MDRVFGKHVKWCKKNNMKLAKTMGFVSETNADSMSLQETILKSSSDLICVPGRLMHIAMLFKRLCHRKGKTSIIRPSFGEDV